MSAAPVTQKCILVVEDNPDNMYVVDRLLTHYGYAVQQAMSGDDALGVLATTPCDLVLMDMQMPGVDGYGTVRAIRDLPGLAGLPVIAVTAHSMPGDRERTLQAGCTDYVAKPINTRELMRLVEYYLRGA